MTWVLFLRLLGAPDSSTVVVDTFDTVEECRAAAAELAFFAPGPVVLRCTRGTA